MAKKKAQIFTVVGLNYRVTKPVIRELQEAVPFRIVVYREPENTHDENAIAVAVDDRRVAHNKMKIGYLTRQVASVLAPALDDGSRAVHDAVIVSLDPEHGTAEAKISFTRVKKLGV